MLYFMLVVVVAKLHASKKTWSLIQYAGWLLYWAFIILTHVKIKNDSRTVYVYAVLYVLQMAVGFS